ncbi:MAG: hypothetical protein EXS50_02990 [Candidatus Taylorbacteria bacterium]|nr:hypothetical protein [Candidatus Taylorbacteria bacterium]
MNKKSVYRKGGLNIFRVDKVSNLTINPFVSPEYILNIVNEPLSETGLLVLFKIDPREDVSLPSFVARWDQNYETLDIDILNIEKGVATLFKGGKGGYEGHHPVRISQSTRTYKVSIKLPTKDIFSGNVTFNINHGHEPDIFS